MIGRHLRVAFYQGQTGPDNTPAPTGVLRHLKVAFSQTEARKAPDSSQHPRSHLRGPLKPQKLWNTISIACSTRGTQIDPQIMKSTPNTQVRFLHKSPYIFKNEGERGRGAKWGCLGEDVSLGSNLNRKIFPKALRSSDRSRSRR